MKQWKSGDKFSAIDYVRERDSIVSRVTTAEDKRVQIESQKIILSRTTPEQDYEGLVWMDTTNARFWTKEYVTDSITSNTTLDATKHLRVTPEPSTITSNLDFSFYYGLQQEGVEPYVIVSNLELSATVAIDQFVSAEETITSDLTLDATAQSDIFERAEEPIISDLAILGTAQENLFDSAQLSIASNLNLLGTAQLDLFDSTQLSITSNLSLLGVAQEDLFDSTQVSITSNLDILGTAQENLSDTTDLTITSNLNLSGVSQSDIFEQTQLTLTSNLSLDATSQFDLFDETSTTITSSLTLTAASETHKSDFTQISITSNLSLDGTAQSNLTDTTSETITSSLSLDAQAQTDLTDTTSETITSNLSLNGVGTEFLEDSASQTITSNLTITGSVPNWVDVYGSGVYYSATVDVRFGLDPTQQFVFSTSSPVLLRANVLNGQTVLIDPPDTVAVGPGTQVVLDKIEQKVGTTLINSTTAGAMSASITDTGDNTFITTYRLPTPVWQIVSLQSYSNTFSIISNSLSDSAVLAEVTANYPPANYTVGTVARVQVYDTSLNFLGTRYVQRVTS